MVVIEALDLGQGMNSMKAPNRVSVELWDGTICALDAIRLTGTPVSPLSEAEHRAKFKAKVRGQLDESEADHVHALRRQPVLDLRHERSCRESSLTWRARGLDNLPQPPLRSARAARIRRWSTRGQPRSRAIGRTEHRSGITAALHSHRTPATGALIFLLFGEIEIVNLRTTSIGVTGKPVFPPVRGAAQRIANAITEWRTLVVDGAAAEAAVYERERLPVEVAFDGPAVVEEDGSTTVVLPGWRARRDGTGNLRLSAIR